MTLLGTALYVSVAACAAAQAPAAGQAQKPAAQAAAKPEEKRPAPSAKILGRDDAAFARALYEAGYADLAEGVCSAIRAAAEAAGKADSPDAMEARALEFDLRTEFARRERDLLERKKIVDQILADKQRFIDENARSPAADTVRNNLPETYLLLGETIAQAVEKETDPAKIAALSEQGQKSFEDAERWLRERIDKFGAEIGGSQQEYAERQHMIAKYNLARTYYFHALLYPEDSALREQLLKSSIEEFSDFGLDYQDVLPNYEGYIYQGLCNKELGETKTALENYDDAIALRETYGELPGGEYDLAPEAADIVSAAVLQKVLLLTEQKDFDAADAAAKDFYATIPDELTAAQGLAVLAAHADSRHASGDFGGAGELAKRLTETDPKGPWGMRGQDLMGKVLGGGGLNLSPEGLLGVAGQIASTGQLERAIDVCRRARDLARGTDQQDAIGAQAGLSMGEFYRWSQKPHEAAVAFDLAHEQFPAGEKAPDALWAAAETYSQLHGVEKRPFYKDRFEERRQQLLARYPKHQLATKVKILEGYQLENEREYVKAAELYAAIPPGTPAYPEAQYRAGRCHYLYARALSSQGKTAEAKSSMERAEQVLKKALDVLDKAMRETLDTREQAKLSQHYWGTLDGLCNLYLETGRAKDVQPLLEDVEQRFAGDENRKGAAWVLRIRALRAEGKLGEATELFESLLKAEPGSAGVAHAAGELARALDEEAVKLHDKDPKSTRARELWTKAARYYGLEVKPQADGSSALAVADLQQVSRRLFDLGLYFNDVPVGSESFVDWTAKPRSPELWERAIEVYQRIESQTASYKDRIYLGKALGFLGRWTDAAGVYARLFENEKLVEDDGKRLNTQLMRVKPELIYAYLEWGVAEHETALLERSQDRFARAQGIFNRMVANATPASRLWWQSKFQQLRALFERGQYELADVGLSEVKRQTHPQFDEGKFGYRERFVALEAELAQKTFREPQGGKKGPAEEEKPRKK